MKVRINHVEKTTGMLRKRTHYGVIVSVVFDSTEQAIIQERGLMRDIVLERGYPSDMSDAQVEKHANRGLGAKLLKAAVSGVDSNHYHLTIGKLMQDEDVYHLSTPIEAKHYEADLKEALVQLKNYILENETIENKSDSFEL